jgi:hypothetical protein
MEQVRHTRSAERRNLVEDSTIRISDKPQTVEILNLSATGCLIRTSEPLQTGTDVLIGLRGVGSFAAEVIRVDGQDAGCQFRKALSRDQLDLSFTNNVHFIGNWDQTGESIGQGEACDALSRRRRALWIVGLTAALWGGIALVAMGIASLI